MSTGVVHGADSDGIKRGRVNAAEGLLMSTAWYTHVMSKRLQVLLPDAELREIERAARAQQLTVAEWVRQALRAARRREPRGDAGRKLAVVRSAARYAFPTASIDQMLAEIEKGYTG
jgi:hypothetical protein